MERQLRVVLFSGGRGSGVLSRQLVANPAVSLTIAINGYDDGASTGEVRRFLRDSLGPSDFRKNASRLAAELHTCAPALIELLDLRLSVGASAEDARRVFAAVAGGRDTDAPEIQAMADRIEPEARARVARSLDRFAALLADGGGAFNFSDCSLGNLVFAGLYLQCNRVFNRAVDEYASLVGLPVGLIENVTDGTNAWLVGLDADGRLLASEEELVSSTRPHRVRDIFLIDLPLSDQDRAAIERSPEAALRIFHDREVRPPLNPRLARKTGDRGSHHLRARNPALQSVSVVLDARLECLDCGKLDRDQAAYHQHSVGRGNHRQ